MLRARKLLFVVLCFTNLTSEDVATDEAPPTIMYEYDSYGDLILPTIPMLNGDADDRLKLFQNIDKSVSGVSIDSGLTLVHIIGVQNIRKEHRIYLYSSPKHSKTKNNAVIGDNIESKSMMMYICINCVFAEWVQNKLIEFVEQLPNMYKTLNVDDDLCILDSDELKLHIDLIEQKTRNLISILFNFITVHSYNTFNSLVDMSLLRTLVSTNILINYISKENKTKAVIVNKFLKIVNKFQKYLVFNCDVKYSYYNKYFFGYSMTNQKTDKDHIDIDEFLDELWEFGLKPKFEDYGAQQMLLGNVLTSNNDIVKKELNNLDLKIMKEYSINIDEKLFKSIENSNDLDVIYWYMNIIVDAIIKIFCDKTIFELENCGMMNISITEGFKILSFLFTEVTIDSQEVIEGFNKLASNQEFTRDEKNKLVKAMKMYRKKKSSLYNNNKTELLITFPYFKIEKRNNKNSYPVSLQLFIDSIINRVSDYKCFINIFKLLKIEQKQNNLLRHRTISKVKEFIDISIIINSDYSLLISKLEIVENKMCKLFINIYEYCVEYCVAFFWDEQFCAKHKKVDTTEVSKIIDVIIKILEYLYDENLNFNDYFLKELLLDILPVLFLGRREKINWNGKNNLEIIRILYIIMIELNKYGLEACTSNEYENFFFNNINYNTVGDHPRKEEAILDDWKNIIKFKKSSTEYTLPSLTFILEIFISPDTDSLLFNEHIRLNWKGELKTFSQISDNVKFDILSPYYINALYNVYFKFHMALLYYNLIHILKFIKYNDYQYYNLRDDTLNAFNNDFKELKSLPNFDIFHSLPFSNNFLNCISDVSNHTSQRQFNIKNFPSSCKNVENIIKKLDIDIDFKFSDIKVDHLFFKNVSYNFNYNNYINQIQKELYEYIENRLNAVELIIRAHDEYEKFKTFYELINMRKGIQFSTNVNLRK
ncbi:hypothetical protein QTP88_003797 [Uroleucon formosanum]